MSDGVTLKRIIDLDTQPSIGDGVYTIVDSETDKAKKFNLGGALSDLNSVSNKVAVKAPLNGWDSVDWTTGYINSNGTVTSNANFRNTDFIPQKKKGS